MNDAALGEKCKSSVQGKEISKINESNHLENVNEVHNDMQLTQYRTSEREGRGG